MECICRLVGTSSPVHRTSRSARGCGPRFSSARRARLIPDRASRARKVTDGFWRQAVPNWWLQPHQQSSCGAVHAPHAANSFPAGSLRRKPGFVAPRRAAESDAAAGTPAAAVMAGADNTAGWPVLQLSQHCPTSAAAAPAAVPEHIRRCSSQSDPQSLSRAAATYQSVQRTTPVDVWTQLELLQQASRPPQPHDCRCQAAQLRLCLGRRSRSGEGAGCGHQRPRPPFG